MGNYMSNQLSYRHTQRVVVRTAMEAGGCGYEFCGAQTACIGKKRTATDIQECMKKTAALTKCMEGNELHFKNYIKTMDKGLDQDEGTPMRYGDSADDRWRWRWWTGMIRIPQQPLASKNPYER